MVSIADSYVLDRLLLRDAICFLTQPFIMFYPIRISCHLMGYATVLIIAQMVMPEEKASLPSYLNQYAMRFEMAIRSARSFEPLVPTRMDRRPS